MEQQVFYRTVKVDGLSIFYREAGPKDAPTHLLAAWASVFVADVSASIDEAVRQIPSGCARLSGLRPQRLAGSEGVRLYL